VYPRRRRIALTSGSSEVVIRRAIPEDIDTLKLLTDAQREALGFVRRSALAEAIRREEVIVAQTSEGVIGFVEYHHRRDQQTTLYHLCVAPEYRRQSVGRSLMEALRTEAIQKDKCVIVIKCPADLPANQFYESVGCSARGEEVGKNRPLLLWEFVV